MALARVDFPPPPLPMMATRRGESIRQSYPGVRNHHPNIHVLIVVADRRFDDKEVGEILKAAAELQTGLSESGSPEGMTLSELQQVAEEVGINPENRGVLQIS